MMPIGAVYAEAIFSGAKTLEIRKSRPIAVGEYRVLMYVSKDHGKGVSRFAKKYAGTVAGEFLVRNSYPLRVNEFGDYAERDVNRACLTQELLKQYAGAHEVYGLCVEDPKLYREPMTLEEFGMERAPQSWRWIEK